MDLNRSVSFGKVQDSEGEVLQKKENRRNEWEEEALLRLRRIKVENAEILVDESQEFPPALHIPGAGYLSWFRGYRFQYCGNWEGIGDNGSSSVTLHHMLSSVQQKTNHSFIISLSHIYEATYKTRLGEVLLPYLMSTAKLEQFMQKTHEYDSILWVPGSINYLENNMLKRVDNLDETVVRRYIVYDYKGNEIVRLGFKNCTVYCKTPKTDNWLSCAAEVDNLDPEYSEQIAIQRLPWILMAYSGVTEFEWQSTGILEGKLFDGFTAVGTESLFNDVWPK